jgi:hypothetical protein
MALAEPHEHHLSVDVHLGEGDRTNLSQRLNRVAMNFSNLANRVSSRKDPTQTRR